MKETIKEFTRIANALGGVEVARVTGTEQQTMFEATSDDKKVVLKATAKKPIPEFNGVFGIPNITFLNGLFNLATYKDEKASFGAKEYTNSKDGTPLEYFIFTDANGFSTNYRLANRRMTPDQPLYREPQWNVVFRPTKSKIAEINSMSSLFSQLDYNHVSFTTNENDLIMNFGESGQNTHNAKIIVAEDIEGKITSSVEWSTQSLLNALKIAENMGEYTVSVFALNIILIEIQTEHLDIKVILPGSRS